MKRVFGMILLVLLDNRGELRLSDEPQEYVIGGVKYSVSIVYETPEGKSVNTLWDRFEHLVKSSAADLRNQSKHDTLTAEYVPAANQKGA